MSAQLFILTFLHDGILPYHSLGNNQFTDHIYQVIQLAHLYPDRVGICSMGCLLSQSTGYLFRCRFTLFNQGFSNLLKGRPLGNLERILQYVFRYDPILNKDGPQLLYLVFGINRLIDSVDSVL